MPDLTDRGFLALTFFLGSLLDHGYVFLSFGSSHLVNSSLAFNTLTFVLDNSCTMLSLKASLPAQFLHESPTNSCDIVAFEEQKLEHWFSRLHIFLEAYSISISSRAIYIQEKHLSVKFPVLAARCPKGIQFQNSSNPLLTAKCTCTPSACIP